MNYIEIFKVILGMYGVYKIVKVMIDMYDLKYKVKDLEQKIDMMDMYLVQYRRRVEVLEDKINKKSVYVKEMEEKVINSKIYV